jgi:hypothetical protein
MKVPHRALALFVLLLVSGSRGAVLEPYKQLLHERILLDTETKRHAVILALDTREYAYQVLHTCRYQLAGLKSGHSYEVRLSYPATVRPTLSAH